MCVNHTIFYYDYKIDKFETLYFDGGREAEQRNLKDRKKDLSKSQVQVGIKNRNSKNWIRLEPTGLVRFI